MVYIAVREWKKLVEMVNIFGTFLPPRVSFITIQAFTHQKSKHKYLHSVNLLHVQFLSLLMHHVTRMSYIWQYGIGVNPKRAGGGAESAPPSTFRAIISWNFFFAPWAFMTFFFQVLRNFWCYFRKNWAYGSKVTQHYVIDRRLKIWKFSGFVYKTWKMASCAKTPFWALNCSICFHYS